MLYHESLLRQLCSRHLVNEYQECWDIYNKITKIPAISDASTYEFIGFPLHVAFHMTMVANELARRRISVHPIPLAPHDVYDEPLFEIMREWREFVPRYDPIIQKSFIPCKWLVEKKNCKEYVSLKKKDIKGNFKFTTTKKTYPLAHLDAEGH